MTHQLYHAIFLVGLPGSGKSTWASDFIKAHPDYAILSSDAFIERFAKEAGIVYNDKAYERFRDVAEKFYKASVAVAINNELNIIIDRTNLTIAARRKVLSRLSKAYKKTAVVFDVTREEIDGRLLKRQAETGKGVSQEVIDEMIGFYVKPTLDEGFDEILTNN
jgi:predicted kinase